MKKVVLDTNTLISGILWDGNEAKVIEKAEKNEILLFISHKLLEELEGVLKREKFSRKLEVKKYTVDEAVAKIALMAVLVETTHKIDVIKEDPEDNGVLECAMSANANIVISGDSHLLRLRSYSGINILSASEFLKKMFLNENSVA